MSTLRESPNTELKQLYPTSRCNSLPFELISTTFQQCNRNDLKQCALTCRSWNAAVRPVLFSKVVLNYATSLNYFASPFEKNSAIGAFVKEVICHQMPTDRYSLNLLAKTFKNIETITFDTAYNNDRENCYDDMYRGLYSLLRDGKFSSLKSIPDKPMGMNLSEIYLRCLGMIKHRITDLDIVGVKAYEALKKRFHTLIKLETINIQFRDSVPVNAINLLEDITQKRNLPSLKRIDVKMVLGRFAETELIPRMDDIQPMPNVSDLKIGGYTPHTIIDDTFMCYIIKKFPNMQRLKLLSQDIDNDIYVYIPKEFNQITLSVDVTVKFLEYIFRMSSFNVQHIATEEKTAEIIESFYCNIKKKFPDVPSSLYIGYICVQNEVDPRDLIFPVVSMKSAHASRKHAPSISVGLSRFYDPIFNYGQEEQKLIMHAGQYLTKITLKDVPSFSLWILLTSIAEHCANLKELVISSVPELLVEMVEYDDIVVNHSLTHLTVDPNVECPNLLSLLSYLFAGLEMISLLSMRSHIRLPRKRFDLIVPRLSVKHFQIELPAYGGYSSENYINFRVFVQLDVEGKSKYLSFCVLYTKLMAYCDYCPLLFDKEITASEFEESKKIDQNYYVYYIQCKSTEKVSIKYASEKTKTAMNNLLVYKIHEVHF